MSPKSIGLTQALQDYVAAHSSRPDEVQRRLIKRTEELGSISGMQIAPEQGEFMTMLTQLIDPDFVVEIGTFTGYSAIAIARGMRKGARLLCCDVSETWTSIARSHWQQAGVDDRIELRLAPAMTTLRSLPADLVVDMAFIDADKGSYIEYYEELLPRLAPSGLICVDNTLWDGAVVDQRDQDESTVAIREFNDHLADDPRVRQVIVPIGDGLTLIRPIA